VIISTSTLFTAALLPDGSIGVRHGETDSWVTRWDGEPARWPGRLRASLDAAALGRGEYPRHCLYILAPTPAAERWECSKPSCAETSAERGDCRLHEVPLVPVAGLAEAGEAHG
jgi:hypothetical protein